jgi:peptidoglycan DL-endopeptidase CwlO
MTSKLVFRPQTTRVTAGPQPGGSPRMVVAVVLAVVAICLLGLVAVPILVGADLFFAASAGCSGQQSGTAGQPPAGAKATAIPAEYLYWYKRVGQQYGVPWTILAGIGTVESDNGQTTLPGVHSGANAFGAAGPMQIGIGGAAGNVWGGAAVHPASEAVDGVATDEDGGPDASVYDPADAIAGAAKYLLEFQVQANPAAAIFAYNHLQSYVQDVLYYASAYAGGGYTTVSAQLPPASTTAGCSGTAGVPAISAPNQIVATAIAYAEAQLGKPYQWGGTGPDAFDCSGLVMMAYRAAGIDIERTSQQQWATETRIPAAQVEPGDLVFFAGSDGTPTSPGHVGLVIGHGQMIEAYATGVPIRIASYTDRDPVGFTRPWTTSSSSS